ncbi:DUF4189 domain-containing protein [Nocardia sp. PE-7]|uniref:DUF4189 domain-containing protein n=1 Tax=Nocardia sp. PE-7 TaxID=3058426 RepID=UPI002658DC10|nr:DUF4189 domain-containing protein [Nocardia sp. PE-7]WKG07342.1 DUF4189 domain-containing protein [Nocardia sp. PE-7]
MDGDGVIFHRGVGYHRAIDDDLGGSGLSELFPEEIFRMSFMGKAGFAVAALGLAAGSVFGAGSASAASLHGAISFSDEAWTYGFSVNQPSARAAQDAALADCTPDDCEIWASWSDGCGAIVSDGEGSIAVGTGATRAEAESDAYVSLSELSPRALLAATGSASFSGSHVVDVICTANAR